MADFKVNVSEELKNIAKPTTTTLMLWSRLRGLKLLLVLQWGREVDLSMVQSQFFWKLEKFKDELLQYLLDFALPLHDLYYHTP